VILSEERTLQVFEKEVLRRISGLKKVEIIEVGDNCIMRSFITCNSSLNIIRKIK
jgi:hypothetical protein